MEREEKKKKREDTHIKRKKMKRLCMDMREGRAREAEGKETPQYAA